jgi:putative peptidoglycan lipid II flippase
VAPPAKRERTGSHAFLVASGIFLSRIFGLVRTRVMSRYFGIGDISDAVYAALRIPNVLQNLLGEGVLSASFIPVYARLLAEGDEREADRVAGAVLALLSLVTSVVVLLGVFAAPFLIPVIAPGFHGAKRELTIQLVRVLFPGLGMLVISAWCLGILNSHRRFFLSYTAPVLWNVAIIVALVAFRHQPQNQLAFTFAWAFVVGSALQTGIQFPTVLRLLRLRPNLDSTDPQVREVVRNFGPVFVSRGVVQISAYVDNLLATLVITGAVTALSVGQTLTSLPVSLFGMSVSAAELPAMSSAIGDAAQVAATLRQRLNNGLRQIAFFVVPCAMGFAALGDVITAVPFQNGNFTAQDSRFVWEMLGGAAIGLLASTLGRLYSSAYWALRDTRTPLKYAVIRVFLTTVLGYACSILLPRALGIDRHWGVAGLTGSAGISAWVEFTLLRRTLNRRIGSTGVPAAMLAKLWASAAFAAAVAWGVKLAIGMLEPVTHGLLILGTFGGLYLLLTYLMGVEECARAVRRVVAR